MPCGPICLTGKAWEEKLQAAELEKRALEAAADRFWS